MYVKKKQIEDNHLTILRTFKVSSHATISAKRNSERKCHKK